MAFEVYGTGRLSIEGGVGTVRVAVYETDGTVAVARTTSGVAELPANSGIYIAEVSVADPMRPCWIQFDDNSGQYSEPMLVCSGSGELVPWNPAWDAEVQSEVDDALVVRGLDHLLNASVTGTDITDNSIIARLVSKSATADWDSYTNTTDSLEAIRDNHPANFSAYIISAGGIAQANVMQIGSDTQSATDLKDFADDGYNPATNKVLGVVLVDTLTTYTGNTVQTGDAYGAFTGSNAQPGQGNPPASATLVQMVGYLYKAWRNKTTQTATQYSLFNDDTTTIDQKATTSDDDTTFTRTEVASGP